MTNYIIRSFASLLAIPAMLAMPVLADTQQAIDPAAVETIKRMTDYLGGLKQFAVHTQTTYEDELAEGQRVDYDVSANVLIRRPNKLASSRTGELVSQHFFYDGKALTLYNRDANVYATRPVPGTIEDVLDYGREELGLYIPAQDLMYSNAFTLMTQNLTSATVVGKTVIAGKVCQHLALRHHDVDFQLWVADGNQPLPCKYTVTDTSTPANISVSTVMNDWNTDLEIADSKFSFTPPGDAEKIDFMPLDKTSGSGQ